MLGVGEYSGGAALDYAAVDAVVDATHRYKEIFYDGE